MKGLITRAQWGARPPTSRSGFDVPIVGGTSHWEGPGMWGSAWAFGHASCYDKVRGIQNYHMSHGYSDVAYNFLPCIHGYVFEGRGMGIRSGANGTNYSNGHSYAICGVRGVGDPFPVEHMDAIAWCLAAIRYTGGAGTDRKCHSDWVQTACPGPDACNYTRTLAPVPSTPTPPAPPPPNVDWAALAKYVAAVSKAALLDQNRRGVLLKLGTSGPDIQMWQHALNVGSGAGLAPDGVFGPATDRATRDFQTFFRIGVDGIVGKQSRDVMIYVLSAKYGV